ncbi:MAG: hypothetical protein J6Y78_11695 [Paludibacteraceae bacterium]|nr:hypothetical protein [Paludibacteraceae bacterium]
MTPGSTLTPSFDPQMEFLYGVANGSTLLGTNHEAKLTCRQDYNMYLCSTQQQTIKSTTMKNNSNNGQTEMNNTKKANKKRIQAEANARRKVAKSWALVAQGIKYRKAAVKESCDRLTQIMEEELFDGILLNLSGRNGMKSYSCQKRILRRIVEKRQAQSAHHQVGRTGSRYTNYILRECVNKSMEDFRHYQMCG